MKLYKSAFTLSEIMVALGVIGILAAVLIPIARNVLPDQNILLARRAYAMTQEAVEKIVNNQNCYPESYKRNINIDEQRKVLSDGNGYSVCEGWDDSSPNNPGLKFATLFSNYIVGDTNVDEDGTTVKFQTHEGMKWTVYSADYDADPDQPDKHFQIIQVDVDGDEPRCSKTIFKEGTIGRKECLSDLDVFQMRVSDNGKIEVGQQWAKDALNMEHSIIDPTSSPFNDNTSVDYHDWRSDD